MFFRATIRHVIALALCAALPVTVVEATGTNPAAPLQAQIDAVGNAAVQSRHTVGAVVGVIRDGALVFNHAYGLANLELGVSASTKTVFRLASLTKEFTAASILLLAERHKLSIDDHLSKYYPDFPRGAEVTLRNLLNHTSGIRNYTEVKFDEIYRKDWDKAAFARHIAELGFDFDPGTHYYYSNSNYYLLGQIIEKVSGQSFAEFARSNLFMPLDMKDTAADDESDIVPFRAAGYGHSEAAPSGFYNASYISMSVVYTAGGTRSTVSDLAKWNIALYGGKVVNMASLKLMTDPGRLSNGALSSTARWHPAGYKPSPPQAWKWTGYGMGQETGDLEGHATVGHGGAINGFNNQEWNFRVEGFVVIVLTNTEDASQPIAIDVARAIIRDAKVHAFPNRGPT